MLSAVVILVVLEACSKPMSVDVTILLPFFLSWPRCVPKAFCLLNCYIVSSNKLSLFKHSSRLTKLMCSCFDLLVAGVVFQETVNYPASLTVFPFRNSYLSVRMQFLLFWSRCYL